jgi:hypothetical protein
MEKKFWKTKGKGGNSLRVFGPLQGVELADEEGKT